MIKHHGFTLLEGYCSWPKLLNTFAIPLVEYPRNILGSITYFLKLTKVIPKPKSKIIPYLRHSINTMG
jgi:hypothetical protein